MFKNPETVESAYLDWQHGTPVCPEACVPPPVELTPADLLSSPPLADVGAQPSPDESKSAEDGAASQAHADRTEMSRQRSETNDEFKRRVPVSVRARHCLGSLADCATAPRASQSGADALRMPDGCGWRRPPGGLRREHPLHRVIGRNQRRGWLSSVPLSALPRRTCSC